MTHNQTRVNALREMQLAAFSGAVYGAVHTLTGHPFDTISKKMLIQANMARGGTLSVARRIYTTEGAVGFMKGVVPPLWGSVVYRSVMLGTYEFAYTTFELRPDVSSWWREDLFFGVRPMVPAATIFCAISRSCIEQPIEYAKVMGQTNKKWVLADIYRGFSFQVCRTTLLLLPIFAFIDVVRRRNSQLLDTMWGNFIVCGGSSAASYFMFWPMETIKNLAQTGTPTPSATIRERISHCGGIRGLYRGVGPGVFCGGIRNGFAQVAMANIQILATYAGLRGGSQEES